MAKKSDFSASEWTLLKDSPYWIQTAITAAEGRMGLAEKRREAKALQEALEQAKSPYELVTAVLAAQDGKHEVDPDTKLEDVGEKLDEIATLAEREADEREATGFKDFLMDLGQTIAEATAESLLNKEQLVSDQEEEALNLIATALRNSPADKRERAAAAAAKRRAELEERRQEAEAAKKKREAEARQAELQKRVEEARQRAEEAQKEEERKAAAAEKAKAAAEARRKRLQEQLKKKREEAKKKAATAKAEAAKAKAAEEAAKAAKKPATPAPAASAPAAPAASGKTYVVQPGDNLSFISRDMYGTPNRWNDIYQANKDKIKNPNLIYPGQELVIPD